MATSFLSASFFLLATTQLSTGSIENLPGLSPTGNTYFTCAQSDSQDREAELHRTRLPTRVVPESQGSDEDGQLGKPALAKDAADGRPSLKAPEARRGVAVQDADARESVVLALSHAPAVDTADSLIEWIAAEGEASGNNAATVVPVAISNSLLITAPSKQLQTLRQIIEQLDRPASQIRIKAILLETVAGDLPTDARLPTGDMHDILAGLRQRGELQLIAQPELLAMENMPATLQLGNRVPRVTGSTVSGRGRANQVSMEDVGTIIKVTCRVTEHEQITVDIDLESSNVGSDDEGAVVAAIADGETIRASAVETMSLQTTVSVHSGRPTLLSGMVNRTTKRNTYMMLLLQAEVVK